jgi:Fe-S-cluster-containing dehydrogenase component
VLLDPVSRRTFLGTVAASAAAMGLASCRKPYYQILPYTKRPEGLLPGIPQYYATTHDANGYGLGVVVRSNTGRPTKVEGNELHPGSLGATDVFAQGELLNLYDPARSKETLHLGKPLEKADHGDGHGGHGADGGEGDDHSADSPRGPHVPKQFHDELKGWLSTAESKQGTGLRLLLPPTSSPTVERLVDAFRAKFPQAVVHTWAPVNKDAEVAASQLAFGGAYDQRLDLSKARRVVSFDHDFLGLDGAVVRNMRGWADTRRARATDGYKNGDEFREDGGLGRLYVAEATHSVTGSNADHRFRLAQSQIPVALAKLAAKLGVSGLDSALAAYADVAFDHHGKDWVDEVAKDLAAHRGESLVLAGPRLPAAAQALAHAINAHLGNVGKTVSYAQTPKLLASSCTESIRALATALDDGQVETLVVLGGNPVYDAPADLGFDGKLPKAKHSVHLGLWADETARLCTWHVQMAHPLEAWGDLVGHEGQASLVQPLIAPMFAGISPVEMLGELAGLASNSYELVRGTWEARRGKNGFDKWFEQSIHDGVLGGQSIAAANPSVNASGIASALSSWQRPAAPSAQSFEIVLRPDSKAFDGRYANNAWMQELPDPLTKLTWDNAALVTRSTAEQLGADNGDIVRIEVDGRTLEAPIWILPGTAPFSIVLTFGYGRDLGERTVAAGCGVNAYSLRTSSQPAVLTGAKVTKTGRHYQLVSTQDHGSVEGRPLVREAAIGEYAAFHAGAHGAGDHGHEKPAEHGEADHGKDDHGGGDHGKDDHGGHHHGPSTFGEKWSPYKHADVAMLQQTAEHEVNLSLFPEQEFKAEHQWGMSIDLNSCTGCGACVVACVAENNIPMVGKRQVSMGREMQWLRIDRYFSGTADSVGSMGGVPVEDDPQVSHQMVPCMQCENAPCESVCPVNATVHNDQGLNDMVYNRCIGTRYCSNNCPYKVRRFNWLNFHRSVAPETQLVFNPDVTVRVRGVMEKCTYCVQRINTGKLQAKLEKRDLRDGDIVTACAQACPADAIAFGDLNDKTSKVFERKRLDLNYAMLAELNVKPRTTYLVQLRNPNPALATSASHG